jgi:hypothetical protein
MPLLVCCVAWSVVLCTPFFWGVADSLALLTCLFGMDLLLWAVLRASPANF